MITKKISKTKKNCKKNPPSSLKKKEPYDPFKDFPDDLSPPTYPSSNYIPIEDGTHIPHWRCLFRDGTFYDEKKVDEILNQAVDEKYLIKAMKGKMGDKEVNVGVFKYQLNERLYVISILKQSDENVELLDAYPYLASKNKSMLSIGEIKQWSTGLEAQVMFEYDRKPFCFHAVDYFQNRDDYRNAKECEVTLCGFIYRFDNLKDKELPIKKSVISEVILPLKEGLELVGMVINEKTAPDEIYLQSEIKKVTDIQYGNMNGQIVTINASKIGELDFFVGDIAKEHLEKGDIISAHAWLHGYIPKFHL